MKELISNIRKALKRRRKSERLLKLSKNRLELEIQAWKTKEKNFLKSLAAFIRKIPS